jgi:hypothetical protein
MQEADILKIILRLEKQQYTITTSATDATQVFDFDFLVIVLYHYEFIRADSEVTELKWNTKHTFIRTEWKATKCTVRLAVTHARMRARTHTRTHKHKHMTIKGNQCLRKGGSK